MTCVLELLFALYFFWIGFSLLPFIDFVLLVDGFPLLLYIYIQDFSSMCVDMLQEVIENSPIFI
jgi:hypothetical protein